jgi:hypothetical protein
MQTAENVGAAYDAIADLFSKIEEFTCRLKVHAGEEIPEGLRDILIKTLITLLQILALSAKRLRHGSRVSECPIHVFGYHRCQVLHQCAEMLNCTSRSVPF